MIMAERRRMVLRIHGDNIIECERSLLLISKAFDTQSVHISDSIYFPRYMLKTTKESIEIELFAGHERWGININQELSNYGSPLREAADSYVTRLLENSREELLFAIEYCNALPAGNNAWQRNGRAITCAEIGIPYLYFAEVGGVELDANRKIKAPRFPNPIVPFSYLTFSNSLNVICVPIYQAHPAITGELRTKFTPIFGVDTSLKLIRFLIEKDEKYNSIEILEIKGLSLVQILSDDRKTIDTFRGDEWKILLSLKSSLEKVNWIKGLKNKQVWKKKTSSKVSTSKSFKELLEKTVALNCLSVGAKDIPICLITNGNIKQFSGVLKNIYKSKEIQEIAEEIALKNFPLLVVWLTGFKPRGDDSRPDRGLVPLARMLFGNEIDILSVVYGPAKSSTWKKFDDDYTNLAEENGLWQAVINLSNYILTDSFTSKKGPMGKIIERDLQRKHKRIEISAANTNVAFGEHDVDTAIHSLFTKNNPKDIFESMCNPPGGDWSGISFFDQGEKTEYRWTSLPRVSAAKAKRPDHVIQINVGNELIFLSIESKNNSSNLEDKIGGRLKSYVLLLFKNSPTAFRKDNVDWALFEDAKFSMGKFKTFSGGAFCYKNKEEIKRTLETKGLDFILSFQFANNPTPVILHIYCGKQCGFLAEIIRSRCDEFGRGIEVKIY
jgi:hypothetical protein